MLGINIALDFNFKCYNIMDYIDTLFYVGAPPLNDMWQLFQWGGNYFNVAICSFNAVAIILMWLSFRFCCSRDVMHFMTYMF